MIPAPTSSATASTSPEPQSPTGATSPMTVSSISPSRTFTPSIAPSEARMPQRICAASNAGPAGAAVASARADEPSTISEFVPTSMKSRMRRSSVRPVARMPATMSGPTYAPSAGNITAGARSCTVMPKSCALASGSLRAAIVNGAIESGSGSMPSAIWIIVAFPVTTTS